MNALQICVHSSSVVANMPDITSVSFHAIIMVIIVNNRVVMYKYIGYMSVTEEFRTIVLMIY